MAELQTRATGRAGDEPFMYFGCMRIAMTGSSGFVGTAIRSEMARRGWAVTRIMRGASTLPAGSVRWDPTGGEIDAAGLEGHDAVLHLGGESLFGIWTASKKRRIERSRVLGTELLANALAGLRSKPDVLLSWSGSDYYGNRDPAVPVTEDDPPGNSFLAGVCVKWEAAARPAAAAGIRLATIRSGLVLDPSGGVLQTILPFFRLGLGTPFGDGRQMWPWVTLEDMVGISLHVIENETLSGPVNAVAPERVDNERFTRSVAAAVARPVLFRVPAWATRLAPGDMADELLLSGAPLVPARLEASGYTFRWPELRPALDHMLNR